jgi:hypothetical protein
MVQVLSLSPHDSYFPAHAIQAHHPPTNPPSPAPKNVLTCNKHSHKDSLQTGQNSSQRQMHEHMMQLLHLLVVRVVLICPTAPPPCALLCPP